MRRYNPKEYPKVPKVVSSADVVGRNRYTAGGLPQGAPFHPKRQGPQSSAENSSRSILQQLASWGMLAGAVKWFVSLQTEENAGLIGSDEGFNLRAGTGPFACEMTAAMSPVAAGTDAKPKRLRRDSNAILKAFRNLRSSNRGKTLPREE
jgi:hypothetical protein